MQFHVGSEGPFEVSARVDVAVLNKKCGKQTSDACSNVCIDAQCSNLIKMRAL